MKFRFIKESIAKDFAEVIGGNLSQEEGEFFVTASYDEKDVAKEYASMEELNSAFQYVCQRMDDRIRYVYEYMDYLAKEMYEHMREGHLPPIKGAGKMQKAMDALGIGEDYEIRKSVVFASKGNGNLEVEWKKD